MPSKFRLPFWSREPKSQSLQSTVAPSTLGRFLGSAPQAGPPQDRPIQLPQTTDGPASIATNSNPSAAPIRGGQNYGIQVLYDGGIESCVDIVFVHGLTGNAYNTWLHQETGIHWPSQLLGQDLPDTRILSFGYDADIVHFWGPASNSRLSSHAEDLVGELVRVREGTETETQKILFVAHSLGGLVTEHALGVSKHAAEKHLHQVERCTAGIVFLGVPHCGADLASWGKVGTRMVGILRRTNKDIVGVLVPGSEMLREVEKGFHVILRLRKEEGSEIFITCFNEQLPVTAIGEVVPLHSAEIKGYMCYGIHANHMDMTKFPNREDKGYGAVLGELLRWKKTAYRAATLNSPLDHQAPIRWKVPRVNPLYTGRTELGQRLTTVFSFDPSAPPVQQRIFVIIGIGGTGKSEVCAKFTNDHEDEYWGIFWLDGRSVATAEQGVIDIGRQCGIAEPNSTIVKSWLACQSQRWLLVIDNADNRDVDYSEYMPSSKRGDILLTTRNRECVAYQTVGSEQLDGLSPELARELLLKATFIPESRWEEKEEAAMAVIKTLGSHTLAIIQAGAFVRQKLCSLEEYPIHFQQQKDELLKFHSKANLSTYGNVYATFEVSAEYLQISALPECLDALKLLHTLAFMHNSQISEALFEKASDYASVLKNEISTDDEEPLSFSVHHIVRLPEYMQRGWSSNFEDRLRWRKACTVLESLSLITMREDNHSIDISTHSLIHAWAKERQDYQSRCIAWRSTATILALSCEGQYSFCPFFSYLQLHARACVSHRVEDYISSMSDKEAAAILFQLAYVLYHTGNDASLSSLVQQIRSTLHDVYELDQEIREEVEILTARVDFDKGNYGEAICILRDVLKSRAQRLAENDASLLEAQRELASAYEANGQIKEAIDLLEHIVKVEEKLAEDHPDRLTSQHELAGAYLANGQIDETIDLLEYVIKIREEKLAEDHPDRLASQHELARAYLLNKQIDKAIGLLEYVVKIREEKLAEDHPDRLTSQHELAGAYLANGQIDETIDLLEYVVKIREEKLAEDHPDRLASQHKLARAYLVNEQIDETISLLEYMVKFYDKKLAEDHPDRLTSQHELARAYKANEQIKEAIDLLEYVIKIREEKLAEDYPDRLASQHKLARAYLVNEQIDEAIGLLEYVVKFYDEKLAEDHPDRLTSQHELARAYEANGQIKEAIDLLEYVIKIREEKLAEDHPDRLASQHELARAYLANGQIDEAIDLIKYVIKIHDEKLAEDHPDRLASQHVLALAYEANGQIEEAIELFEHVVRVEKETLAEDHPSRLTSQHQLARAYEANGQFDKAIDMLEHVVKKDKLPEDHPDRLASQRALARVYKVKKASRKGKDEEIVALTGSKSA